jgi:excisionase family DNA binding protein
MVLVAPEKLYTTGQVGPMFHVTSETVRDWHRRGLLKAVRLPGGHLRVPQSEIDRLRDGLPMEVASD